MIINPAQQVHGEEEIQAGIEAVKSGRWAEGPHADEFRSALKKYLGVKYALLVNSGSSANLAALMSLTTHWIRDEKRRLKPGDEVITAALCFPTTVSPIIVAGCIPVFVDVEPGSWQISPKQIEEMITPKTKAVMVAHNLGAPFNLTAIVDICKKHNLWLISDMCDALGTKWDDKLVTQYGDIWTSSFYPAHHISTGEGGAVYTNNTQIYLGAQSTINWGRDCYCPPNKDNSCGRRYGWKLGELPEGYDHKNTYTELGFNLKMTDIQAAIGVEQLKKLDGFIEARRFNHHFLARLFAKYDKWFEIHTDYESAKSSWFGYVIKLRPGTPFERNEMVEYLDTNGIKSRAFFCGNITRQPMITDRDFKYKRHKDLSVSDDIMNSTFWIGCHPGIRQAERDYMEKVITQFLDQYNV